jgi:hypothetical protein
MGFPIHKLATVGARTGQQRQTVLGYFDDPANPQAWIMGVW